MADQDARIPRETQWFMVLYYLFLYVSALFGLYLAVFYAKWITIAYSNYRTILFERSALKHTVFEYHHINFFPHSYMFDLHFRTRADRRRAQIMGARKLQNTYRP